MVAAAPGCLRFLPAPLLSAVASDSSRADDIGGLCRVASRVAERLDDVVSWLGDLCADDEAVRAVAQRSYWHPNGFAKLILYSEQGTRLRLHVWPAASGGPRLGESNPHSHRWQFASTVVTGDGLHMVEYRETDQGGKHYDRYRYGADPTDRAALSPAGQTRLARRVNLHVHAGQVYRCDTDIVHTVAPIGQELTATLVVQGPRRTDSTVVYRKPGLGDDQPNGVLTESDFRTLATGLRTAYAGDRT
jgi:hypothetical protein